MAATNDWYCSFCTYLNKGNTHHCIICKNKRRKMNDAAHWSCSICTFKNQALELKCTMCQQGTRPVKTKTKRKTAPKKEEPIDQNSIITVGDQVTLCNCEWHGIFGIVYCIIKLGQDEIYGVRLLKKSGSHNGWYKSVEYFKCEAGYGAFVTKDQILSISEVKININRITLGTKVYVKRPSKCIGSIIYIGPKTSKLSENSLKKKTYVFGRYSGNYSAYDSYKMYGTQNKTWSDYSDHLSTVNATEFKKELDEMYYGVCLRQNAKVFVKRNDLEYPISKQHQIVDTNENKMVEDIKENVHKVSTVYDCFKITNVRKNKDSKIIKIFVTENAKHCIVVQETYIYKEYNKKSSASPPLFQHEMNKTGYIDKYSTRTIMHRYSIDVYKLNEKDNTFQLMECENNNITSIIGGLADVVYDEHNWRVLLNVGQSKIYCVDIIMSGDAYVIVSRDFFNLKFGQIIFASFLNEGNMILCVFNNGSVIAMDTKSFKILNKFDVGAFYPKCDGVKTDKVLKTSLNDQFGPPTYAYINKKRKQDLRILTVALNENKNCIAWIESEYDIMYYLQIYSLKLITTSHEVNDKINYKKYLITSRLIAQKTTMNSGISYALWYREEFRSLMKRNVIGINSNERLIKKGNTQYSTGTMAGINNKTVKLMFNDAADKLLYCSMDNMSNDLLVIDRNTMSTLNVTCKGIPSGWIFKDYLIVSQIGRVNVNKFNTLNIQGFISETSVAELLCYHALAYLNFPWVLCLEIAVFVGSSREFRDITFANYTMDNEKDKMVSFNNILLERNPCDMVWNVGNYVVIMLKHSNEIIFYDSSYMKFKDEDTMITYTEGHAIIARNNNKNLRTFQQLWIDQSCRI